MDKTGNAAYEAVPLGYGGVDAERDALVNRILDLEAENTMLREENAKLSEKLGRIWDFIRAADKGVYKH